MRTVVLLVALAGLVVTGCERSDAPEPRPRSAPAPRSVPAPARNELIVEEGQAIGTEQVEPEVGAVKLWVTNQSFVDDPVDVTIWIDGAEVISRDFWVEDQHTWIPFFVRGLDPGEHAIAARSDTGVEYAGTFTVPPDQPRWLVLTYWYYRGDPQGRHFALHESERPVAFA